MMNFNITIVKNDDFKTVGFHVYAESKHALLRGLKPQTYFGGNVEQTNVMGNNNIQGGNAGFTAELSKLVELLAAKETSLQNAQAHIDRLLAIIDNLTKQQ